MILDRSAQNIKEIVWSDINDVLNEIADYYLTKFDKPNNIKESLLRQFEQNVNDELMGINIEDYLRTRNSSLELIAKYNKLLKIKSDFFGGKIKKVILNTNDDKELEEISFEDEEVEEKPTKIENYLKEMEKKLKEKENNNEVIQASMDPNATIEEIEEDYSAIAELLGDENIVIKFKEN